VHTEEQHIPILIAGGALVGLSTSLFLAWHGVPSLVVEKHPEPARLPRARGYNARTMELFRAIGLEETIRAAQSPTAANHGMIRTSSLASEEMVVLDEGASPDLSALTPTTGTVIGQDTLEPILIEQARKLGSDIRFSTELISFEQNETGVSALLRDRTNGREWRVRADYLIAADGNRSRIREALGIKTQGPGTIAYMTDIAFEADLSDVLRGRNVYLYYISNPALPDGQGGVMPLDNQRRWSFGTPIHPERGERREDMTDERCIAQIRIAVGVPDLDVKILPAYPWDAVKVGMWEQAARAAERYQQGRVFLVGDAAHAVLPSGGLGAGTGIQDAFNLAWKLALVHSGKAGSALLRTYEEERLPIGNLTVEQTRQRYFYRTGTGESRMIDTDELVFGYRYRSAAIITEGAAEQTALTQPPATLNGEPGTRIPNLYVERDGKAVSTIDLCAGKWSLLVGEQGEIWKEAAQQVDLPLQVCMIGKEWKDVAGRFGEAYGVEATGAVLVRPDLFVAWRTCSAEHDPSGQLARAVKRILCLNQ
jgi:putative polyketide hydroxylase